ncbi:hypothetical protein BDW22DRAFT_1424042 [Trametopsis cervina]|nr:hypothetical protein BDW22DRAFT_1424042 [Trametopsis cervina]
MRQMQLRKRTGQLAVAPGLRAKTVSRIKTSLLHLPDEILTDICELLYYGEERRPGTLSYYFGSLKTLSCIHFRLKAIVERILVKDLSCYSFEEYDAALYRFRQGGEHDDMAHLVRRMCVRSVNESQKVYQVIRHEGIPFSGLVEFRWTQDVCTDSTINHLASCPNLETLELAWEDRAEWPRLDLLPKLRTVRLALRYAINGEEAQRSSHEDSDAPFIFPSITTLALYHDRTLPSAFMATHLPPRRFPSLRAFTLEGGEMNMHELFHFIHCHPTLLEVNIGMAPDMRIRPEALLQLIDGTGTWKDTVVSYQMGIPICQITLQEYNEHAPYPQAWVWSPDERGIPTCRDFAFTRIPWTPNATEWQHPIGSPFPRYACTALALQNLSMDIDSCSAEFCTVTGILLRLPYWFPILEELRISTSVDSSPGEEFAPWMGFVALMASNFRHLKKLAIHPVSRGGYEWGYKEEPSTPPGAWRYGYVEFLDDVIPPYDLDDAEFGLTLGSMLTLTHTGHTKITEGFEELLVAMRAALHLENDAELDEYDGNLLMQAWQARNEHHVTQYIVRRIAQWCPSLKQFEWYAVDGKDDSRIYEGVRWLWKIERDTNRRPRVGPGELLWTGCAQGNPPMFYMLVGSELERALKDGH